MRASFAEPFAMRDDIVLLAGRLLLAWIFLHEGAFLLANYSASSAGMAEPLKNSAVSYWWAPSSYRRGGDAEGPEVALI